MTDLGLSCIARYPVANRQPICLAIEQYRFGFS